MNDLENQLKNKRNTVLNNLIGMPKLLNLGPIKALRNDYPTIVVHDITRRELEGLRQEVLDASLNELDQINTDPILLAKKIAEAVQTEYRPSVAPAINATGIILHTALGRAPLCEDAQRAVANVIRNYCTIAIDQETGKRGDRYKHVENLLCQLTGAEAACVVNNNSAATMLILNTLGEDKEVLISRGQLVEIGGSFRMPDVMKRSHAIMVEVGTTNKTHLRDYREAITDATSLIMRVHTSNYQIIGFSQEVSLKDLVELGHQYNLPVVDDIGSGCLIDFKKYGLPAEPMVQVSIKLGFDVVTFSGDKILSGPQCGIIVGKKKYIDQMKKNPLARAMRCDKYTFAALEATLKLYLDEEHLADNHPVLNMLTIPIRRLANRANTFKRHLNKHLEEKCDISIMNGYSQLGSGSLPAKNIATKVVALKPKNFSAELLGNKLRAHRPPIFSRIENDALLLDLRTIRNDETKVVEDAIFTIFNRK
jgi:L-seryl-tRNA(Ser) seleniumtransferase